MTLNQKGWIFTIAMMAVSAPAFISFVQEDGSDPTAMRDDSKHGANVHSRHNSKTSAGAELHLSTAPAISNIFQVHLNLARGYTSAVRGDRLFVATDAPDQKNERGSNG